MTFIKREDIWGIRKAVRKLWQQKVGNDSKFRNHFHDEERELAFNAFFNQFIPKPFRETKETVLRHKEDILKIIESGAYKADYVWVKQGNSLKCVQINQSTKERLSRTKEELPTYEEIEEEKMRWQANPSYDKDRGVSQPILEEFVQLKFTKK